MDGLLLLDKPRGLNCQKILSRFRRAYPKAKGGYTGTLDPFATGVLPLFLGAATKLIPYISEEKKTYEALLRLGEATDTLDCEGKVTEKAPVPEIGPEKLHQILPSLLGKRLQSPPQYSAIKVKGVPLYRWARKGVEVEVPDRPIEVFSLEWRECTSETLRFEAEVSRGTYIRSLGVEIARALGTVGHLQELRRLKSGSFRSEDCLSFENYEILLGNPEAFQALLQKTLRPLLENFPSFLMKDSEGERRLLQGQTLCMEESLLNGKNLKEGDKVLTFNPSEILSISEYRLSQQPGKVCLKPLRILKLPYSNFLST
ncbi:MAG: tRNA pseudouridine(55) synthase TruB [bacterium]